MKPARVVLDQVAIQRALARIAHEILEAAAPRDIITGPADARQQLIRSRRLSHPWWQGPHQIRRRRPRGRARG